MTATDPHWGIPDPETKPDFYRDVATKRLLAWFVDTVIILALCAFALPFTAFLAFFFLPLFYVIIGFVYRSVTLSMFSATLGMRLFAVEIRTIRGDRLVATEAILHTLGYTISISIVLVQVVSMILMVSSPRGQGLTDMVLGTVALNRAAGR